MDTLLAGVQLAKTETRREEDLNQRQLENEYRRIEDSRRLVDLKSEQLKAISNLAALVAGFTMMMLVESNFPNDLTVVSLPVLCFFGGISTLVVGMNLLCLMVTSLMLVAVLNFDCSKSVKPGELTFEDFWESRCQRDWEFAFKAFIYAVPLFLVDVALVAWVVFEQAPVPAIVVSVLAGIVLLFFVLYAVPAWGGAHRSGMAMRRVAR